MSGSAPAITVGIPDSAVRAAEIGACEATSMPVNASRIRAGPPARTRFGLRTDRRRKPWRRVDHRFAGDSRTGFHLR
jgi:hypothetical protein